jgi:hypothetical protein
MIFYVDVLPVSGGALLRLDAVAGSDDPGGPHQGAATPVVSSTHYTLPHFLVLPENQRKVAEHGYVYITCL